MPSSQFTDKYGATCSENESISITTAVIVVRANQNQRGVTKIYYGNSQTLAGSDFQNSIGGVQMDANRSALYNCQQDGNSRNDCVSFVRMIFNDDKICVKPGSVFPKN